MLAAVPVQTLRNETVDGHFARRQLPTRVSAPPSSFLLFDRVYANCRYTSQSQEPRDGALIPMSRSLPPESERTTSGSGGPIASGADGIAEGCIRSPGAARAWCRTVDRGPAGSWEAARQKSLIGEVARHSGGVERPSGKAACTSALKLVIAVGPERGWRTLGRLTPSIRVDSDRGPADQ